VTHAGWVSLRSTHPTRWAPDEIARHKILIDNPKKLYRLT